MALEEEMKVLKDKLRSTDEKLQKCKQCGHLPEQQVCLIPLNSMFSTENYLFQGAGIQH